MLDLAAILRNGVTEPIRAGHALTSALHPARSRCEDSPRAHRIGSHSGALSSRSLSLHAGQDIRVLSGIIIIVFGTTARFTLQMVRSEALPSPSFLVLPVCFLLLLIVCHLFSWLLYVPRLGRCACCVRLMRLILRSFDLFCILGNARAKYRDDRLNMVHVIRIELSRVQFLRLLTHVDSFRH